MEKRCIYLMVESHQFYSTCFIAEGGAVMYLPISNGGSIRCPTAADAAAVSLTQV